MILSCNNISKSFGTDVIIKSCSFNIEDHEKADKTEKADKVVKTEKADKTLKAERVVKTEKTDKTLKAEKTEKAEKTVKTENKSARGRKKQ